MPSLTGHINLSNGRRIAIEVRAHRRLSSRSIKHASSFTHQAAAEILSAKVAVHASIEEGRRMSKQKLEEMMSRVLSVDGVERLIENNFATPEYASIAAGETLLEKLNIEVGRILTEASAPIAAAVDVYLANVDQQISGSFRTVQLKGCFSARAEFYGAVAAGGCFGALALTSHIAAAGSNLGAYVLVAKVSGMLGLSTASVINALKFVGGPTGAGLVLSAAVGLVMWAFSDSWQRKLADQLTDQIAVHGLRDQLREILKTFWDESELDFQRSSGRLENSANRWIKRNHSEADDLSI